MALVQADEQWGGYAADATTLITAIRDFETETCGERIILRPGDAWGGCSDNDQVSPGYFAPGYYRAFAQFVPTQAAHWNQMVEDTYELYAVMQPRMDGLFPDWSTSDGGDWASSIFGWSGCQAPWRVATDYAWTGDANAALVLQGISAYVENNGGISGVPFEPNSAFRGSLALSGMASEQTTFDSYVDAWLTSATMDNDFYYQAMLRVLFLTLAAGRSPSTL